MVGIPREKKNEIKVVSIGTLKIFSEDKEVAERFMNFVVSEGEGGSLLITGSSTCPDPV